MKFTNRHSLFTRVVTLAASLQPKPLALLLLLPVIFGLTCALTMDDALAARPKRAGVQRVKSTDKATKDAIQSVSDSASSNVDKNSEKNSDSKFPKVKKIIIKGTRKIEVDAVTARLITKQGDGLDPDRIRQDVEALFKSGYFYDVQVGRTNVGDGVELTYTVVEKPSIVEIAFSGNSELNDDEVKEAAAIKPFEILNMTKVRESTEKLQKLYEDKGFFLAKITPKIDAVTEGESVKLTFEIEENEKVKVKRITFLGNRNLGDGKLKSVMETQEGGFFSAVFDSGAYKQDKFDRDLQVLNYAYFNEGYLQVKIDRPQVYVTPDKKGIFITIRVEEGDRFKVGTVDFAGDLLFDKEDLFKATNIQGSGWYVHETLLKDLRTLQAKYGDLGYAYANIIPRTRIREKDKEVDISFEIDKGNKVYFHRINVVGNTKTRDKVVRRELLIREGELYNETRKRESMDNVRRLGFFEDVNFNSSTPPDGADLMNIDILVKERNTGTIQVGAGYSTYSQFIFNGQINQINLFGRGQKLGLQIETSKDQSRFDLNFTEPYFLDTKWSVGFDAFANSRTLINVYSENKKGGGVRVGHPLAPYLMGFINYQYYNTLITLADPPFQDTKLYPVETANGDTSSGALTIEYDKRDDRFSPTKGLFTQARVEYAGLGGTKKFTKAFSTIRFYRKVLWDIVSRNNLTYGFINSNDPNLAPPFNELYLLGGANSLRGFDWYSVGRRRHSDAYFARLLSANYGATPAYNLNYDQLQDLYNQSNRPYGGTQELYYQTELEFPLVSEAGIKGVVFFDVGAADDTLYTDSFRSDVGFGFRWFSPIGPLRFEWGFPLARLPDERPSNFQFAIGSPF